MSEATRRALSSNRKKRGVIRASITKLRSRLAELKAAASQPARRLTTHLVEEFKVHHFSIIDLLDEEEDLAQEQEIYDFLEEEVNQLTFRLEKLISLCSSLDPSQHKIAFKRLNHLERNLSSLFSSISSFSRDGGFSSLRISCQNSRRNFLKSIVASSLSMLTMPVILVSCCLELRKLYLTARSRFEGFFTLTTPPPLRSPTPRVSNSLSSMYQRSMVAF